MQHVLQPLILTLLIGLAPLTAHAVPPELSADQMVPQARSFMMQNAEIFLADKPDADAMSAARKVQMLQPDNVEVLTWMARHAGPDEPDSVFVEILHFTPDPNARHKLGWRLIEQGYPSLANTYLKAAADDMPDNLHANSGAGASAYYSGRYEDCVLYLGRALNVSEPQPSKGVRSEMMLKAGRCHAELGHKAEAAALFDNPIHEGRDDEWDLSLYRDKVFDGCSGRAESHLRGVQKAFDKKQMYQAYRDTLRALKCDPANPQALDWRIRIEATQPKLARWQRIHEVERDDAQNGGQTTARRQASLQTPDIASMLSEGETAIATNTPDRIIRAVYLASRVLLLEPDNPRARLLRARALNNLQIEALRPVAWDDATRALKADPTLAVAHHVRGVLLRAYNAHAEAVAEYDKAIALDPADSRFYVNRSSSFRHLKQYDRALSDINIALKTRPDEADLLLSRGMIHYALKNHSAARADFDRVFAMPTAGRSRIEARLMTIRMLDESGQKAEADKLHLDLLRSDDNAVADIAYLKQRNPALDEAYRVEKRAADEARIKSEASKHYVLIAGKWDYVQYCAKQQSYYMTQFRDSNGAFAWEEQLRNENKACIAASLEVEAAAKFLFDHLPDHLAAMTPEDRAYLKHARELNQKYLTEFYTIRNAIPR